MRNRLLPIVIALFIIGGLGTSSQLSLAGDGAALFESLKCGTCHKPEQKAAGISLAEIAKAYGDSAKLAAFFKGESPFLIESTKTGMMKGQMKNLAALSDQDKKALSDYILSFK
jgi:cytochrome c551/c552